MRSRQFGMAAALAATLLAGGWGCGDGDGGGGGGGGGPVCSYAISPAAREFAAAAGTGQVAVSTTAGCSWTAATGANWIIVTSGATGSGPGSVAYTVAANTATQARTGSIDIAGQTHQVTQQGATPGVCTYTLVPSSVDMFRQGGSGSFSVRTGDDCPWTAVSTANWLTVTSGAQGTGPGTVSYSVGRNQQETTRVAQITVAGQAFTVRQEAGEAACDFSVAPVEFTPCMPGGTATTVVSTGPSCPWTASPNVDWLTITQGVSGTGPGVITFSYTANYDAPRDGAVRVRWNTPTEGQNVWVKQAGCRYWLSIFAFSAPAAGTTGSFEVLQQSEPLACGGPTQNGCVWTAVSDVAWIAITSTMPQTGDSRVSFTVAPNAGASRTGRITVRDQVVVVTQAGT